MSRQSARTLSPSPFSAKFRSAAAEAAGSSSAQSRLSLGSRVSSSSEMSPAPEQSSTALPGFALTKSASSTESVVIGNAPPPSYRGPPFQSSVTGCIPP